MKHVFRKTSLLLATAVLTLGAGTVSAKPIRIGAAVYGLQAEFMQLWSNAAKQHPAVKSGEVEVTVFDGRYDALVQENQFDTMVTRQFDAIVFVPIDAEACASAVAKAAAANIPVIGSNTRCNSDQLASFVGSDDVKAGEMVANAVLEKMGFKGNVVVIEGPIGQSAQIDRAQGIKNVLDKNSNVTVLEKRTANWSRAEALSLMENWLTSYRGNIGGIIAQNDEMALGAIEAIKAAGLKVDDFSIAGVDGITDALRAVKDGSMESVLQDAEAQAQGAIDVAIRQVIGSRYQPKSPIWTAYQADMAWADGMKKHYNVPWTPVTRDNVEKLLSKRGN
ncbi:sugar ABC transporter substrate-binding protein [Vibrio sp. S9_S30]|uniref:substrate-binding domain-containing protein n=1 Tax=Vibrio sp. S9_S30 TaxID=2720226 RepID=UPI001680C933|nr:substrate-binding domain-containing protein [Vibrio sp. S9_S30]MBD1555628.1 sugar ABC transporter substrate-binding protein [Vibrio sp. S9_S30]